MTDFSFRQLQKCAEREVAMRTNVFSKRGMTPEREVEVEKMEAIAKHFKMLADGEDRSHARHGQGDLLQG
jgi:hypothetical protein